MRKIQKWLVGVDEAGRGPLAGPVAVGVVCVPYDFDWNLIEGVDDSKRLSEIQREVVFRRAKELERDGVIVTAVSLVGAGVIDSIGITNAVHLGIVRGLKRLPHAPHEVSIKLDGLLRAPEIYTFQETITKGDQKEKVIGLASIMAKVSRDRRMIRIARQYPQYGFETHKGYGTRAHRDIAKAHGLCAIHRKSFCKNLL